MTLDIHKLQRLKNTLILPLQMITELDGRTVFSETLGYDSPSNSLGGPSYTGLITRKGETWTIPTGPSPSQIQQVSRTEDYTYDYAARLSGWDDASNGENISYDARGNITSRSPRYGSSGTITLTYTGDRLATRKVGTGTAVSFAHDSFARMTTDAESGLSITYNAFDLPETISSGNNLQAKYTYLADGTKVSALDASGAGLVYRGPFTYRRSSGGTLAFESAPFERGRLTETGVRYHVTDHLGSVRAVIDGNASTTTYPLAGFYSVDDFTLFGIKSTSSASSYLSLASTGSTVSLRDGFTGQEDQGPDFGVGYSDFGARQYSPVLSRWLVPDPMGEKYYDLSPYSYCAGDPVNLMDADGNSPQLVGALGGALIGGIIGGGIAYFVDGKRGREFWGSVGGGAVTGAIVGATGGMALFGEGAAAGLLQGALTGAVGSTLGSVTDQLVVDQMIDMERVAVDAASGAVAGTVTGLAEKGLNKVMSRVVTTIEEKYASQETVNAVRDVVKNELKETGRSTGYRNRSLIEKTTTSRINTMKSAEEYLVKKAEEAVNGAQNKVNNWWINEQGTNLYEQYKNGY